MTSITPLRASVNKDPTKEDALRDFFSLPPDPRNGLEKMEINAVLTLQDQEESYVRVPYYPVLVRG